MNGSQNNDILNDELVFFKDMTPGMLPTFQRMDQHPEYTDSTNAVSG